MNVPFGMLFEECETLVSANTMWPTYDPIEGLSYVTTSTGQRVPYVIWASSTLLETKTADKTKASLDTTDKD